MPFTPLIYTHLPIAELGVESQREISTGQHPPLNRMHVWWARRPLIVSGAAVLASLLPAWSPDWPAELQQHFSTAEAYHAWFRHLLGIRGDPVAARRLLDQAVRAGKRISNPYGYPRAFTTNPAPEDLAILRQLLRVTWGTEAPVVLDPMAGGGSIPFEALRYGLTTWANELNPVAAVILTATLDYPARFGTALADDIRRWGERMHETIRERLRPYFTPLPPEAEGAAYLWARTVTDPVCGKPVPLSPNWWLQRGGDPLAVRLVCDPQADRPRFEIAHGDALDFDPDDGTVRRGVGLSPWTGEPIPGDYIKTEAQEGRVGQMLYAIATKRPGQGFVFRLPTPEDEEAAWRAEAELSRRWMEWEARGLIPAEPVPQVINDPRPLLYGMTRWCDFFSPRQLLSMGTFVETLLDLGAEIRASAGSQQASAVMTYLGFAISKAVNYNSYLASWHAARTVMRSVFDRHDFSLKWSFGEFDASANLWPWCVSQVADAYEGIARLAGSTGPQPALGLAPRGAGEDRPPDGGTSLNVTQGPAQRLPVPDGSAHAVIVDPPYYDNVMYAELSDFFYVWLKRTVGDLYPDLFSAPLTDKDEEAVANAARFRGLSRPSDLARQDYERKMTAAFAEMARALRPDGVLTVMFTHKQTEAWDTLGTALIEAGFSIHASWPVHTESEHSLHQAQKNAARSTVLLACRKRPPAPEGAEAIWWDDLQGEVRRTAREAAQRFLAAGIRGVDLYISTFGPVLAVISRQWPVLTSQVDERTGLPGQLRPEAALDLARREVIALRKAGLLEGRDVRFDPTTDWTLIAWDTFRARRFPADEARKLGLALGLDIEADLVRQRRLVAKMGGDVILQQPNQRQGRGRVDPQADTPASWVDAVHTALWIYGVDGAPACQRWLREKRLLQDATFRAALGAFLRVVPRVRDLRGKFRLPEADLLERLRSALFDDMPSPAEEEGPVEQLRLL